MLLFFHYLSLNRDSRWGTADDFATSFLHFSLFSTALWDLANSRPVHSLMLSSHLFLCLPGLLPLCLARWFWPDLMNRWHHHTTAVCVSLLSSGVFVWSNCLLDLDTDFLVSNMVFVWDLYYLAVAPHFHGLYSSLEFCCEGPWFTCIQEDGCDKGAHQSYLGTERSTPVIPNWFQPCKCCSCQCYPGEHLGLGTLISYNWTKVLEVCDSLKLLSIYFDLCVDVTGVVCRQLGLLGTDFHAGGCGGFVNFFMYFVNRTMFTLQWTRIFLMQFVFLTQTCPRNKGKLIKRRATL